MQRALNGTDGRQAPSHPVNDLPDFGDFIDNTPRAVAAAIVAAVIVLFLLKRAGFRFNFGVGANVGR